MWVGARQRGPHWHMADTETKPQYEVTGFDKDGRKVFHLLVEAVNADVAKLYATVHLQRTPGWRRSYIEGN